jgi:2-keto-4-pentenoate hydratase/2-oxohepta-3-ene-1,7-dioic acid hydratase in catechol pathway
MRFVRFDAGSGPRWGRLDGERIQPLGGPPWETAQETGATLPVAEAQLLPPAEPSKIVAVGRNYSEHAAEMGGEVPAEPLLFLKASSALLAPGGVIVRPPESSRVDYEGELVLVIGRRIKSWPAGRYLEALAGICAANDVTARDLQKRDGQFARAKSFDTFCPLGPNLASGVDPSDLSIATSVNGVVRQSARTSGMIFSPAVLVAYISRMMTLLPGDLILTGTPSGVGPLEAGDTVTVEIETVGRLTNSVA